MRLLSLLFILTSCATNTLDYQGRVASWKGHNVSELVASWGAPTNTVDLPDGTRTYGYVRGFGRGECHTSFTADSKGLIMSSTSNGLGCY